MTNEANGEYRPARYGEQRVVHARGYGAHGYFENYAPLTDITRADPFNWDLVGNNIPVFFIQDAMKFPDLVHAAKQEPDRGFPQAQTAHDNFWDFASLMPESTHMLMWIMSDRAIPRSFRTMEGFGVHTFRLLNEAGRSTYVKFHWKSARGLQSVAWNEAVTRRRPTGNTDLNGKTTVTEVTADRV